MSDDINIAISPESWNRVVRERDEAREDLEFRRGLYKVQDEYFETARRERDEAREKAERYRLEANAIMMQRDEAREEINRLKVILDLIKKDVS